MAEHPDSRPEVLFCCQVLPYPPDGGVYIRSYHILALLSQRYRVTAVCFFRRAQQQTAIDVAESVRQLVPFAQVHAFPIPQEWSTLRFIWDHLRSVVTGKVYTHFAYSSRAARDRVRSLLKERDFAFIHVDSLDLGAYLPHFPRERVACTHHNLESALLLKRARRESSWVRSAYVRYQARLMERAERFWAPRVAVNVMVSDTDADGLRKVAPGAHAVVVTNGVDIANFRPAPLDGEGEIVFVGGLNWFPNLDGLEYFVSDILPLLRSRGVKARVRWIGNATSEQRAVFAAHGVELTGYVVDIRPYMQRAACVVVPLRVGGGTRLKVLDAWALGKAMVSTTVGAEGLKTQDGENILLRDTPESFASGIECVLNDDVLRRRLEAGGRATVESYYGWQRIARVLASAYAVFERGSTLDEPTHAEAESVI